MDQSFFLENHADLLSGNDNHSYCYLCLDIEAANQNSWSKNQLKGITNMPTIGTISFTINDGLDSGIALLLTKPPEEKIDFTYGSCQLLASPSTPYVVFRFFGASSLDDAYNNGSLLVQEILDMLSITGHADLAIREAEDEHLVWWTAAGTRSIAFVSTATFAVKIGPITLTVHDAQGNIVPPTPVIPKHNLGFRFYRLSQVSDELYDAYRNMYLAFEYLLSSKFSKGKGFEKDWLYQSLQSASTGLGLPALVPPGTVDPIAHIISVIYENARLPLFHAKDGKAYFAPVQSVNDRELVASALDMLTQIVIRMADIWYSARRISGSVNLKIFEQQDRELFDKAHFIYTDNPNFTLDDDLESESIINGIAFPAMFNEYYGSAYRHNISGTIQISSLNSRKQFHALYLLNDESMLLGVSPDTIIDLTDFDILQVCLFIRARNANVPKYIYSR
jgi:hypothetical protein